MKYRFKTKPYKHQVEALKFLLRNDGGALAMEMGTMKTKVWIDWASCVALRNNPRAPRAAALVVAPLPVLGTWHKELKIHDPWHDNDFMGVQWRVINYDKIWRPHTYDEIVEWLLQFEPEERIIIADECHSIKNHAARRSKAMHRLAHYAARRSMGTGTMVAKGPLDLYSQFKFLDDTIFGSRYEPYRRMYAVYRAGTPIIAKYTNLKRLKRKIRPHLFVQKLDDCMDLPKARHETIPVQLTGENKRVYDDMAKMAYTQLGSVDIEERHVLTLMLRLQQIGGGWVVTNLPSGNKHIQRVGTNKLDAFSNLVEQLQLDGRKKIVVFARFRREIVDTGQACKKLGYKVLSVHGGNRRKRERIFTAFHDTKQPTVLICQIGTGSMGRNELVVARDAIFYSVDWSYINFDQAMGRLRRPGQHHKVMYWHLLAPADYSILLSLRDKRNLAKLIMSHRKLVYGPAAGV